MTALLTRLGVPIAVTVALAVAPPRPAAAQSLDFAFFKARVEPVFLEKRPDHARCYTCHSVNTSAFHLERLSPGADFWTEEQSRRNFENVVKLVTPGDPASSLLMMKPLAPEAGGQAFHSGGRQFASESDPDWQILAEWVSGKAETTVK